MPRHEKETKYIYTKVKEEQIIHTILIKNIGISITTGNKTSKVACSKFCWGVVSLFGEGAWVESQVLLKKPSVK